MTLGAGMMHFLAVTLLLAPVLGQDGCEDSDYKSEIGLDFRIHCKNNAPGHDIRNKTSSTLQSCIDDCGSFLPSSGDSACRAISYNVDTNRCFLKDGNVTSGFTSSNNTITAIANAAPFQPNPESSPCPGGNGTVHTDNNGMEYTILCSTYWGGNNFDPGRTGEGAYQPFHADTLLDCMNYCSDNSPFCFGVRWAHSADDSYRNCWPKKENITHSASDLKQDGVFVAAVGQLQVNSTCTGSSKIYTASNKATFEQACDTLGDGPDIDSMHARNYEECMDFCAQYQNVEGGNTQCGGVLYQPNAKQGFKNCYLKYALSNVTNQAEWHMATLKTTGEAPQESHSENKAWIAGAVAGPLVALAAIAGLVVWYRRRRAAKTGARRNAGGEWNDGSGEGAESVPFNSATGLHSSYHGQESKGTFESHPATTTTSPPFNPRPSRAAELSVGTEVRELPGAGTVRHELQS